MKKGLTVGVLLLLLSAAALAQPLNRDRFPRMRVIRSVNSQVTRPERLELRKDAFRYEIMERKARRDGVVTPLERKRLHKARRKSCVDQYRFRHNGRRRLI